MRRVLIAVAAAAVASSAGAQGFPIAPQGTECRNVFAGNGLPVVATYLGNSAAFTNDLFLSLDAAGNPGDDGDLTNDLLIFTNQTSPIGSTFNLGSFASGTELIFRLFVRDTKENFFSGPATRNPDTKCHARVQENWQPNTTLVSFEDLFNTPEEQFGFNDLSFSFTNTNAGVVPEPSTYALLGSGLLMLGLVRRRRR